VGGLSANWTMSPRCDLRHSQLPVFARDPPNVPLPVPVFSVIAWFQQLRSDSSRWASLLLPSLFVHAHHDEPQG